MSYWRLSALYFFYFSLLGCIVPFWNLYLYDLGYSPTEIGYLGAILLGTKVVSPYLLGWLTDKTGNPVRVICWSNFLAFVLFSAIFALAYIDNNQNRFVYLALVIAGFSFFWNAVVGQYEALTLLTIGNHFHRYGPIRAWGSVGFILAVTGLGYLFETLDIQHLPKIIVFLLLAIWISSLWIKEFSFDTLSINSTKQPVGFTSILKRKDVLAFFIGCFLVKFAHGPYYTFYSIYLEAYGYSKTAIGLLWGLGVFTELLLFFVIGRMLIHYQLRTVLVVSVMAGVIRWTMVGVFPESLLIMIMGQILHAATFASYHAAAVEWVRRVFGRSYQGQGQALYSAMSFGAGGAAGAFVSGLLWTDFESINWLYTWLLASATSFIAIFVFWFFLNKKYPSEHE